MSSERRTATSGPAIVGPLKWHSQGGKHYLANRIIALCPPHLHYVEPFAGGLAVLLAKDPEGVSEVANDLNGDLVNFWCVLQDEDWYEDFRRRVEATPFCEEMWKASGIRLQLEQRMPSVDRVGYAAAFFVHCRQSLAGRMKGFTGVTRTRVRRGMNNEVSAWLSAVEGLPAVHDRLKRVLILNRPALDVIRGQDGSDTLYYCDPPYLHSTRATTGEYAHEMTETQHFDLLKALARIKGKFLLSGYRSDLYDADAERFGWRRVDFSIPNAAAGGKEKRVMTECVWFNFPLPDTKE